MRVEICYEQVDIVVANFLKQHIGYCEKQDDDPYETNDNTAHLLSALYRTLEYCTSEGEYREFVEEMKSVRNSL